MKNKNFNLEGRTLSFSKTLINVLKEIPKNPINIRLIDQCIRSGTSIGANYREANESFSRKDLRNKIKIAKQEAKETLYWIELLIEANKNYQQIVEKLSELRKENMQIMKILGAIYRKLDNQC